jgi:hypothetical protein
MIDPNLNDRLTSSLLGWDFEALPLRQQTGSCLRKTNWSVLFNNRAFHSKLISTTVRDATYVLDGLLYHESNLRFVEHYTDTTGFADHVFAMMHLLGFRFAPNNTESERNEVVLDRRAWFLSRF